MTQNQLYINIIMKLDRANAEINDLIKEVKKLQAQQQAHTHEIKVLQERIDFINNQQFVNESVESVRFSRDGK